MDIGLSGAICLWISIICDQYMPSFLVPVFLVPIFIWESRKYRRLTKVWLFAVVGVSSSYFMVFVIGILGVNKYWPLSHVLIAELILSALILLGLSCNSWFINKPVARKGTESQKLPKGD